MEDRSQWTLDVRYLCRSHADTKKRNHDLTSGMSSGGGWWGSSLGRLLRRRIADQPLAVSGRHVYAFVGEDWSYVSWGDDEEEQSRRAALGRLHTTRLNDLLRLGHDRWSPP
jgi:hypothetical protein